MSSESLQGKTFGKYRVVRRLAGGGMGEVYLARHEIMDGEAAVKVLLPEMSGRTAMVKRFFAEAKGVWLLWNDVLKLMKPAVNAGISCLSEVKQGERAAVHLRRAWCD